MRSIWTSENSATRDAAQNDPDDLLVMQIVRMGFLDYVETIAPKPAHPLFPDMGP